MRRQIQFILVFSLLLLLTGCGGGKGSSNPVLPPGLGPPPGGGPSEPQSDNQFPYQPTETPLPGPTHEIYFDISTDRAGKAILPGFDRASKRSLAYLPMRVTVVESDGDPLRHIIIRRMLLGDDFALVVWDATGFYNPRIIHSAILSRTTAAAKPPRSAMLTEVLGRENPATTNIGFGVDSIDITIGLDKISELNTTVMSTYWSYFTDDSLIHNISKILSSNIFGGNIVRFHGTYTRWNLADAVSTMTSDGALIYIGGYVDINAQRLSTFQMGTEADDLDDDILTNSLVSPRIPSDSTNCYTVFSSVMQVAAGTNAGAVASNFDALFQTHPIHQNLGDEQRYMVIHVKPIVSINPSVVTTSSVKVKSIVIILPLDPRVLTIEPADGTLEFNSGISEIYALAANYTSGAKYALSPVSQVVNWFRNSVITTVDPTMPGDVIAHSGQGLLPSATFLAELNRDVVVEHYIPDYLYDEKMRIVSNFLHITPEGGSVTNLPPDLSKTTADPTVGRAPLKVTFNATKATDPDSSIISYEWNFGNPDVPGGGAAHEAVAEHTYASPGVRTAILTVKDNGTPQRTVMKQFTITISSNMAPTAIIGLDVQTGRAPLTVNFDGTQSFDPDGTIASFFWDFGDGTFSQQNKPQHVFSDPDTYTVTLTVTDNGPSPPKSDIDTVQIIVTSASSNRPPVASFTADPESGEAPLTVQFNSSASSDPDGDEISYQWFFGDSGVIGGGTSTEANPVHVYNDPQTPTVTLIVTDNGSPTLDDQYQMEIEITPPANQSPIAKMTMDPDAGQEPLTVNFSGSESSDPDGLITGYSWNFGDPDLPGGGSAFGVDVQHVYESIGVFTVTLIVSDNGLTPLQDQVQGEVVVGNSRPIADIQTDLTEGHAPLTVHFDASGSTDPDGDNIVSYHWDFGTGITSDLAVTNYTFNTVGQYTVTLTVTDDNSTPVALDGTATVDINATQAPPNQPPVVVVKSDIFFGSAPLTVNFNCTDESYDPEGDDIVTYLWDFGDTLGTSNDPNPLYVFNSPGIFQVICSLTDDGFPPKTGYGYKEIYVDTNVPPIAIAEADVLEGTVPLIVNFTGDTSHDPDGNITSYDWNFGTGDHANTANAQYTFNEAGQYVVILTVQDDYSLPADGVDTVTINANPVSTNLPPVADIIAMPTSGRRPLHVNLSSLFSSDPDGTIAAVLWNFGDSDIPGGGESTDRDTSHTYASTGDFVVTLTVWDNGTPPLSDDETVDIHVTN